MPANFFNATAILQTSFLKLCNSLKSSSFLKPCNSLKSSSFLETSTFHSMSICCFIFLALNLQTTFILIFVYALSALKGLQAALALAQGVHEVTWL